MDYKVSVVVPIFNAKSTIGKCIESVQAQSLDSVQIILIDDGSTDGTAKMLKQYEENKNVLVVHKPNEGVSRARNVGIDAAGGKYIFFLDSDDYIEADALAEMYDCAERNQLDLVVCSHTEFNATLYSGNSNLAEPFIACSPDGICEHFSEIFPKSACAKLFKRELLIKHNLYFHPHMRLGEDLYFTYSYMLIAKRIGKVGAFYRIQNVNATSLSKRYVEDIVPDLEAQELLWKRMTNAYPRLEEYFYKKNMDCIISLAIMFANNLYKSDCPLNHKQKMRLIKDFLWKHSEWTYIDDMALKGPKNKVERLSYIVIHIKSPWLIGIFFWTKELVKKIKFKKNILRLKRLNGLT